jgi:hypothetical protein
MINWWKGLMPSCAKHPDGSFGSRGRCLTCRRAESAAYEAKPTSKAARRRKNRARAGMVNPDGELKSGACKLCPRVGKLVCDHDHTTGRIRGWVCYHCNNALAALDQPGWLERAQKHREP